MSEAVNPETVAVLNSALVPAGATNDPTALAPVATTKSVARLQAESGYDDEMFKDVGGVGFMGFLPRLQLFTSNSEEVKRGKIDLAAYGIIKGKEKTLIPLGKSIVVVPISWRPKAMFTKANPVMAYHNPKSDEFKDFKARALADSNSGYMFGPEFLIYMGEEHGFVTFFFGSKTARNESPKLRGLLPVDEMPYRPAMLTAQFIENKDYSWHGPLVTPSSQNITLPSREEIDMVVQVFLKPKDSVVEETADTTTQNADR